jgi:organic radical activating enzyme
MFDGKIKTTEYGSLVVTHECNKHCKFCIDKYRGQCEYITLKNVEKALLRAKDENLKEILIVGGEPTLHPNIIDIAKMVKEFGFKSILTTNYTQPWVIKQLDGIVDCFNISFYNQKRLPMQCDFVSDITITTLVHQKQLSTKSELDSFIDKYKNYGHLKFSTLMACNDWTKRMQAVGYLDEINAKKVVLFDEIEGLIYRGYIIKRYDRVINKNAHQSFKFHVDGEASQKWER